MTGRRAALAVSLVVAASMVVGACVPPADGGSTPTPQQVSNDAAATWLLGQFDGQGVMPNELAPTVPDLGNQVLAVANLEALGVGAATAATRLEFLEANVEEFVDLGTGDRPGALARLILAVVAADGDPRSFGGSDLVERLEATQRPNGLFGAQPPDFDGSFRQGLALAALSLAAPTSSTITAGVAWLKDQQCDDGSWLMYRASTVSDCVEHPSTGAVKDSNGTALAVLGLAAVGATAAHDPQQWLTAVRGNDGGWGANPSGPTQPSDANSTGLVIAALEALGVDIDAAAWDALLGFQLDSGAFYWKPSSTAPNRLATLDAMTALFDRTWPAALAG